MQTCGLGRDASLKIRMFKYRRQFDVSNKHQLTSLGLGKDLTGDFDQNENKNCHKGIFIKDESTRTCLTKRFSCI